MKLQQIHINQFGHFTECDLNLPGDGLQVIYGPNEAGKTTLLQFLRGWLFDFPPRTPYDFNRGSEIAGVGTLVLADRRVVELRRRKGTKNKVVVKINGRDTGMDEVGFQNLLGHANRSLFESIFAFGLDQLSQGEESLKHESLQSALFGGGLGKSTSPERILQELDRQAGDLFNSGAKKPAINQLLSQLKDLESQIKTKSLRSDDYRKRSADVEKTTARATELHQSVDQLRREHGRLEKLCRAFQKWRELEQAQAARTPLKIPSLLPADARAKYAALSEKILASEEEASRLSTTIAGLQRDLAALQLDPNAVSFRAEIRACLELKQSFLEAKADLPKLTAEHAATRQQIDRDLNEQRPGWTYADLRSFVVDIATRSQIDQLVEQAHQRETEQAELRAKREQLSAQLRQARADLDALGDVPDVAPLLAVLADESAYSSDRKVLDKHALDLKKLERQLAVQSKKLSPPLALGHAAPQELPAPRVESIRKFEDDFAELREQSRTVRESMRQDESERNDLREKLDELVSGGAVPSLDERDNARQRRDSTWSLIRRRLIEGDTTVSLGELDPASVSDSFEQQTQDADSIADKIYDNADAVVRREELGRQCDLLAMRIASKQERIAELERLEADLQQRWCVTWEECGFTPLAPDVMRSWLVDHEAVCELIGKREEIQADTETLREQVAAFENRLRAACADSEREISVLLVWARDAVDVAKTNQNRSRDLRRDIKRLEPQLLECDTEFEALNRRLGEWQQDWNKVLTQLRLPTDQGTNAIRNLIEALLKARVKLDTLPQEEARLAAMQARLEEFAARVRPLCEAVSPDLLRDAPEVAIEKLSDQLERAADAQQKHEQLRKECDLAQDQCKLIEDRRARLAADRAEMFAAAEVVSEIEFMEVVACAEKARQLDADIEQRTHEIGLICAGEDQAEFQRQLGLVEPDVLDGQRRDLAEQLQATEQQMREADGAAAVARQELSRLDGSGEAAILTDQLSRQRSRLASEVDRYVPLLFARHLLNEAVRRFERDNQPEMIATVSDLLSKMTAGRYTKFERASGNAQGILVRQSNGLEKRPEQLSTGTREQLYLAIRLAYVLHYCRQSEPLPIVMDDVLVNFDEARARNTLATLAEVAQTVQVLFFTCHPHMVALAKDVQPGLQSVELPSSSPVINAPRAGVQAELPGFGTAEIASK